MLYYAHEIHSWRYTVPGLKFLLSFITEYEVTVTMKSGGDFFFCSAPEFSLPSEAMILTGAQAISGTPWTIEAQDNDECVYLLGLWTPKIKIHIEGTPTAAEKELITAFVNWSLLFVSHRRLSRRRGGVSRTSHHPLPFPQSPISS